MTSKIVLDFAKCPQGKAEGSMAPLRTTAVVCSNLQLESLSYSTAIAHQVLSTLHLLPMLVPVVVRPVVIQFQYLHIRFFYGVLLVPTAIGQIPKRTHSEMNICTQEAFCRVLSEGVKKAEEGRGRS